MLYFDSDIPGDLELILYGGARKVVCCEIHCASYITIFHTHTHAHKMLGGYVTLLLSFNGNGER